MNKKSDGMKKWGLLSILCLNTAVHAETKTLTITPVLTSTGTISQMDSDRDWLIVGDSGRKSLHIIDMSGKLPTQQVPAGFGIINVDIDRHGWIAACVDLGRRLVVTSLNNLRRATVINFPAEQTSDCTSVSLDSVQSSKPQAWIGSAGNRHLFFVDLLSARILKEMNPISGPFTLRATPNYLFVLNEYVKPHQGIPFVMEKTTQTTVVGDPMGQSPTLYRGYASGGLFIDEAHRLVHMLRPSESEMHSLEVKSPDEKRMLVTKLNLPQPKSVAVFGSCVAVLGHSFDKERWPQWVVLKSSKDSTFKEVANTGLILEPSLRGSIRHVASSGGSLYVAHWGGTTRVDGLFEGLKCEQAPYLEP